MSGIAPDNENSHEVGNSTHAATLLIVDDNPENLQLLFSTLRTAGYRVLAAQDADSALIRATRNIPDLILLDIMMPQVDGFELCQRLREHPALGAVPIIFLSALADGETVIRGLGMEAVDYITKPFLPEEVLARVGRHLELARLRGALALQNQKLADEMARRQRSEEAYRVLVEESLQGLAIVQDQRLVFVNKALTQISGYREEEIIGVSLGVVGRRLCPWRSALPRDWITDILDRGGNSVDILRVLHRDGSDRCWEVYGARVNYQGKPAVQISLLDITDRIALERTARRAQERVQDQASRLSILNELALSLSDITDLDSALGSACHVLGHLFRHSDIAILLREPGGDDLLVSSHLGRGEAFPPLHGRRVAISQDSPLAALHTLTAVSLLDGDNWIRPALVKALGLPASCRELTLAPLITHGAMIGLMLVMASDHSPDRQRDAHGDLGLLETTAAQMAGAIESAQLFRESQARSQALLSQQRFTRSLLEASPGPVFVKDPDGVFLRVNRAFAEIYGVSPEDMAGRREEEFNHDKGQLARFRENNREALASGRTVEANEELIPGPDGRPRWYKSLVSPFFDEPDHAAGVIGSLTDITDLKHVEEQLASALAEAESMANQDGLTGLANRRYFDQRLDQEWRRGRREGQWLAVMMVDLDFFKQYNDRYGHLAGDGCLQAVADLLETVIRRPGDLAARYGGEEFVVLMPGTDLQGAGQVAANLRARLAALAIEHPDAPTATLTLSAGIAAMIPDEAQAASSLVQRADENLYRAKREGRDRVVG